MAREIEGFRDMLAWLSENYPGLGLFNQKQAALVLGCTPRTAKSRYGIDKGGIDVVELAKLLCRQHKNKNAAQRSSTVRR